ncbi:hypothetical protein [Micromonospora tulbaghiae]|uniref:hypothetical protein n=1 Tax=Micromonospora tulbaghiae TaxID=479978 RepID=UPI0029C4C8C6|nr:hypothetical protein [Micromonospora tulbaghiae]MDX5458541.1 hypothetical protein [Micromonospora tulbaghiae]
MPYRAGHLLGPSCLVERLVAALGGGHDLGPQLPPELRQLLAQFLGGRAAGAALRSQRDGQTDEHDREDRQDGAEPDRAVAVGDQQDERSQGRQPHTDPEQDGEQGGRALVGGRDRGGHG